MLHHQLNELGFTPNQAAVYVALLALGQTKAGAVVARTGLHRHLVYHALRELVSRTLAAETKHHGIAFFQATDPSPLVEEREQKTALARQIVAQLKRQQQATRLESDVLTGGQGMDILTRDVLAQKENLFIIGEHGACARQFPRLWASFHAARATRGIYAHFLVPPRRTNNARLPYTEIITLPYPVAQACSLWIYGHTTALMLWETPVLIYRIRNKKIAESFRDYFTLLRPPTPPQPARNRTVKFL